VWSGVLDEEAIRVHGLIRVWEEAREKGRKTSKDKQKTNSKGRDWYTKRKNKKAQLDFSLSSGALWRARPYASLVSSRLSTRYLEDKPEVLHAYTHSPIPGKVPSPPSGKIGYLNFRFFLLEFGPLYGGGHSAVQFSFRNLRLWNAFTQHTKGVLT